MTSSMVTGLNPEQLKAVEYNSGPLLILAGAGSGKTRVITYKIAHLIQKEKKIPASILTVTFTNKAADEIKQRVSNLIKRDVSSLWIGTFHSICSRILRVHGEALGFIPPFIIFDSQDSLSLIKNCMANLNIDDTTTHPKAIQAYIDKAKNRGLFPQDYLNQNLNFFEKKVANIYALYQKELKKNNALDFGDLILLTVHLFKTHPDILTYYQDQFHYVLIDEYQDTNKIQYVFAHMLAQTHKRICVVGDEDQSIYKWRGADINNILDFEKDYPHAELVKLEQNYRSTKNIIEAAKHMISNNKERHEKALWTENSSGELLQLWVIDDEYTEAEFIVQEIKKLCSEDKYTYNDCAIFYRVNALSRVLEDVLRKYNIPYQVFGGFRFYERKEVKDLLAYLRLILNPHDSVSFLRVINVPPRRFGKSSLDKVSTLATNKEMSLFQASKLLLETSILPKLQKENLTGFVELIEEWQKAKNTPPSELLELICTKTKYIHMLKEEKTLQAQSRLENLDELKVALQEYEERSENPSLEDFLQQVTLSQDLDGLDENTPTVKLLTAHSAKGLEFPIVFIVALEEGLFPHSLSLMDVNEIEEERRLFYVGLTRAKERLFMTRAKYRRIYGNTQFNAASRFIEEIPSQYLSVLDITAPSSLRDEETFEEKSPYSVKIENPSSPFKDGERVSHPAFGRGKIVNCSPDKATIKFDTGEIKKFVLAYTPLEKI